MKPGHVLAVGAVLGAGAILALSSGSGHAQFNGGGGPISGQVVVAAPDGGLRVTLGSDTVPVTGNVSASVSGAVVAFPPDGGMRVSLGGDTVPVSGTVGVSGTIPVTGAVTATVSGSVVAYPPDGGSLVTFGNAVMPITCAQPDGGTCVLDVQGRGGGALAVDEQGAVEVTGLAGARVGIEGPVTATISGTPAVTVSSGTVGISGTVSLSTSSLASITAASAERVCTYGTPLVVAALTTTPSAQPASSQAGRTEITLTNLQTDSRELLCRVAGTPSATNAIVIKAGVTLKLNVTDTQPVNCMCSASTCRINLQEAVCTHP